VARLLIGSSLRGLVERWPFIHRCIWGLEAALFSGFLLISWLLPLRWAQAMASRVMGLVGPRQSKHRHVRRNLELAFPDKSDVQIELMGRAIWGNIGKVFAEYAHLFRIQRHVDACIEIRGRGHVEELVRSGRAAVLVAAHLGNWEIGGIAMRHLGLSVAGVYSPLQNPYLDWIVKRCRASHGSKLLPRDDSMRLMIREIINGRAVGLIMDQRVDSGSAVPFFGNDKWTTLIPARLALRHNVDLIPMRTERLPGGRFRVTFNPPVQPDVGSLDEVEQAKAMTARINDSFEAWIRERPEDWFCTTRLWPKDTRRAGCANDLDARMAGRA
jgi:KDO2-lipid IV(A) lauroyltransferase